jgi:hypothetical protein
MTYPLREGASVLNLFRRRKTLKVILPLALVVLLTCLALYSARRRSVLFSGNSAGDPFGEPGIVLFNPFRDSEPESSADEFLRLLRSGQREEALRGLPFTSEYREYVSSKEEEHRLVSWRLKNRHDLSEGVRLFFWHSRADSDIPGRLWITVAKPDDKWEVTDFECIY